MVEISNRISKCDNNFYNKKLLRYFQINNKNVFQYLQSYNNEYLRDYNKTLQH